MFKTLLKNKKAQNTAEYALLIALVVAGVIAMQTYAQRALQARVRDASVYLKNQTPALGSEVQYEPYYLRTEYDVTRDSSDLKKLAENLVEMNLDSTRTRAKNGFTGSAYDSGHSGIINGF